MISAKKLKIGSVYRIQHTRKGSFVAMLVAVEETQAGDKQDELFLTMKYDVRAGTDQVGLSIAHGKDRVRISNLRPSLIRQIDEEENGEWLREVVTPEEKVIAESPKPSPSLLKKLAKTIQGKRNG